MIVIKIKTWKDWKKDFLDWVQAPRRRTCKEYVDYMEALQNQVLYKRINDTCDKYGNMREGQIDDITEAVDRCVAECAEETRKLIDKSLLAKFF
jgi:hypothetical protein